MIVWETFDLSRLKREKSREEVQATLAKSLGQSKSLTLLPEECKLESIPISSEKASSSVRVSPAFHTWVKQGKPPHAMCHCHREVKQYAGMFPGASSCLSHGFHIKILWRVYPCLAQLYICQWSDGWRAFSLMSEPRFSAFSHPPSSNASQTWPN